MKKKEEYNATKRVKITTSFMIIGFLLLGIRIYFIQIIKGEEYKQSAIRQQIYNIDKSIPRGIIFDRNGVRLTNREKNKKLYVFRRNIINSEENIKELKQALNYTSRQMEKLLDNNNSVIEISLEDKNIDIEKLSSINNVIIIDKEIRNNKEDLLSHVIGEVRQTDNTGLSGIEKSYDNEPLKANLDYGKVPLFVDARQIIVPGVEVESARSDLKGIANSLKLTIDYDIQKQVEKILDDSKRTGAVIVAEVDSGDILSMASRPNRDLRNIQEELEKKDQRLFNKALELSYPPGSIFKIPVLLVGLESGEIALEDKLICKGYEKINNNIINCNKREGHGELTILEGFYKSCNSTFIQIGKKVGSKQIIDMAKILGFGEKINIGLDDEVMGNLPTGDYLLGPAIGHISIGQAKIEVTPLQVTNMMMIVANGGIKKDLSIVGSYVTEDGAHAKKIMREEDKRVLPKELVNKVKEGLDMVVEVGTARNMDIENIGGGGGKTGSAQALKDSKKTTHAWFTGYFPKDNPKYVITVFIEDGRSGSAIAAPIFEKIAKEIYDIDNQK